MRNAPITKDQPGKGARVTRQDVPEVWVYAHAGAGQVCPRCGKNIQPNASVRGAFLRLRYTCPAQPPELREPRAGRTLSLALTVTSNLATCTLTLATLWEQNPLVSSKDRQFLSIFPTICPMSRALLPAGFLSRVDGMF